MANSIIKSAAKVGLFPKSDVQEKTGKTTGKTQYPDNHYAQKKTAGIFPAVKGKG